MGALAETIQPAVRPRIAVVIPAYNEERFICSVVITALQYAETVIVVDDGSSDRTASLAAMAGAEVVQMPTNVGKGLALNAGFKRAQESNPAVVVTLDGDAQHDPAEIPELVQPILQGEADVVIGSRFLGKKSAIPRWRQAGQHALTVMTNTASGVATTDSQSGYRAFTLSAIQALRFGSRGLAMESEMQFLLQRTGLQVAEVPIGVQYRDGNKRNPVAHGLQIIDAVLALVARRRPLLFFGLPGMLLAVAGFLVGLHVVGVVDQQHVVPFGTAIFSTLLVLGGILFGMTGVILNSLEHFMTRLWEELHEMIQQSPHAVTSSHD